MDTIFFSFANNLFFPITLSGSLSFFGLIIQSEYSGKDFSSGRRNTDEQINLFTLGVLLSVMVGWWIAFVLYLSMLGISKLPFYSFPPFGVFVVNFLICTALSFAVPPIIHLFYNALILGFLEALIGGLAHVGFAYLFNYPDEWLFYIPFVPIAIFGALIGIGLRFLWFFYKGA